MDKSESFALKCFEAARSPARLEYIQPQSHGERDFDIYDPSGMLIGVLEVTMAANEDVVHGNSAVFSKKHGSGVAGRAICQACWSVTAGRGFRMSVIRAHVDEYLAPIEAAGLTEFDATTSHPAVASIRRDLRIGSGRVHTHSIDGRHFVAPPPVTGWIDGFAVNHAVAAEAAKSDNLRKLDRPELPERHLFVFVDMSAVGAFASLQHREASPEPPCVDSTITHVWAGTAQFQGHTGVFWHAENGSPWRRGEVSLLDWPPVDLVTEPALQPDASERAHNGSR